MPEHAEAVVLLGPAEPGFWTAVSQASEFADGRPDPLDRWSRRVIGDWAERLGATPLFPFDGPRWLPFIDWAKRTGRAWASPATFLVHGEAGLFLSLRGALALPWAIDLPPVMVRPCDGCETRACLSACPVAAPGPGGYDVAACHERTARTA